MLLRGENLLSGNYKFLASEKRELKTKNTLTFEIIWILREMR